MEASDILDLFSGNDAQAGASAAALAQAIRQRRAASTLGAITGDSAMGAVGKEIGGQADRLEQGLMGAAEHRASQDIQRQHLANQAAQLQAMMGYRQNALGIQQQNADTRAASAARPEFGVNGSTGQTYIRKPGAALPVPAGSPDGSGAPPAPPRKRLGPPAPVPAPSPGSPPPDAPGLEPWDKRYDKMADSFKKDMDAAAASSRSSFGESARVVFRGARNLAILNQKNPDGSQKQLTEPEWQEVAGGLVAMQTGAAPTQEMMRHALPHDVQGNAASIMSWLTSAPHAPDRQEWIQRFLDNIDREEKTALKYQRDTQMQRLPSHSQFFSLFPNRAKLAAKGYGIDPALVDQIRSGKYDPAASAPVPAAAEGAPAGATDAAAALRKKYGL